MRSPNFSILLLCIYFLPLFTNAQHENHFRSDTRKVINVEPQPLLAHAMRISEALNFAGCALSDADVKKLKQLQKQKPSAQIIDEVQHILDPYCIAHVDINPEARVKVEKGSAV